MGCSLVVPKVQTRVRGRGTFLCSPPVRLEILVREAFGITNTSHLTGDPADRAQNSIKQGWKHAGEEEISSEDSRPQSRYCKSPQVFCNATVIEDIVACQAEPAIVDARRSSDLHVVI